jgi:F0F1-type ATP synthase assembly protein I
MLTLTIQYIGASAGNARGMVRRPAAWCNGFAMADEPSGKGKGFRDYVRAESMVMLALALPAGCFIGWLLGSLLDRHFHTAWIAIAGIVLGAAGGFMQIFRAASKYLKNNQ